MRFAVAAALVWACVMHGQEPKVEPTKPEAETAPLLHNDGKPMLVPFQCTDDDMIWAGMSCSEEQPCPVYLEVSALETVGNRIFALANIHSDAVTLYSVLLASEDEGATWREPYERMRSVVLDHVQFIDFQNGWISGGTLVPVARDPFLLITSDGGKTWRLRPVFSEGGGGTIQQFWFQSATSGEMVIDRMQSAESGRYELYETPNSGGTWMIRRTSDSPIPIKRASSSGTAAGWRIRADARSKAFVIEKHQGDRWSAVASFLVHIGNCKPAPRVVPPPPEPAESAEPAAPAPPPAQPPSLKRPKP